MEVAHSREREQHVKSCEASNPGHVQRTSESGVAAFWAHSTEQLDMSLEGHLGRVTVATGAGLGPVGVKM